MNCFDRQKRVCISLLVAGVILLIGATISVIMLGEEIEFMALALAGTVIGFTGGLMLTIFGGVFWATGSMQRKTAEVLFSEREIAEFKTALYLHIEIVKKAKRLQQEGKQKGDMSEYNDFRELVLMTRPMYGGAYGGNI